MSNKELSHLEAMTKMYEKRLTIPQTAAYPGLCSRQIKKLSKRLRAEWSEIDGPSARIPNIERGPLNAN